MPLRLEVFYTDKPVKEYLLDEEKDYDAGRDPASAIHLICNSISRRHAQFTFRNQQWILKDLDSKNGTLLDGKPIVESHLSRQSWLSFGKLPCRTHTITAKQARDWRLIQQQRWRTLVEWQAPAVNHEPVKTSLQDALNMVETQRACLYLRTNSGDLKLVAQIGFQSDLQEQKKGRQEVLLGSQSAIEAVLQSSQPIVSCDTRLEIALAKQQSIMLQGIRTLACLPLIKDGKLNGVFYTDSRNSEKLLSELDLTILQTFCQHLSLMLDSTRLQQKIDGLSALIDTSAISSKG